MEEIEPIVFAALIYGTVEQLIADRGFVPENVIDAFLSREIFTIGATVSHALAQRKNGRDWRECGLRRQSSAP